MIKEYLKMPMAQGFSLSPLVTIATKHQLLFILVACQSETPTVASLTSYEITIGPFNRCFVWGNHSVFKFSFKLYLIKFVCCIHQNIFWHNALSKYWRLTAQNSASCVIIILHTFDAFTRSSFHLVSSLINSFHRSVRLTYIKLLHRFASFM